jgi:hypothetical protein
MMPAAAQPTAAFIVQFSKPLSKAPAVNGDVDFFIARIYTRADFITHLEIMSRYQHTKGQIKDNAIEALLHDPLFRQRVEKQERERKLST